MANTKTDRRNRGSDVQRITTIDSQGQGTNRLFIAAIALILIAGVAAIVFLASQRTTNIGVAPEAGLDHWHDAYLIHNCGEDLPPSREFENPDGLHTHGDGLFHIHPYNPSAAGTNATLGTYFEASGATLTDESFETGPFDLFPVSMSEADGCDGEPAVLQLAYWSNAFDESEPEIITENLADFVFDTNGAALTLALLPEGAEIPKPDASRLQALATTNGVVPVDQGTLTDADTADVETDADSETSDEGADADSTDADADADADADSDESDADAESTEDNG